MQTELTISIGQAARRHGISPRAIRFYEERTLIQTVRNPAGHRCLDGANMARITTILQAQQCGFTLTEIGQLLDRQDTRAALRLDATQFTSQMEALATQQAIIGRQIAELKRVYQPDQSVSASAAA